MKNKGRKHKATSINCKGWLTFMTRPLEKMGTDTTKEYTHPVVRKLYKKQWGKRMRSYMKSPRLREKMGWDY